METISIKMEETLASTVELVMRKHHYTTKTEFIREAIRDKIHLLKKEEALTRLRKMYGSSKRKTTDNVLHAAGERAFLEIEKEIHRT